MSAIAGICNFNQEPVLDEDFLKMMGALQKFPADDIQIWKKAHLFFGCHSQWITPESVCEKLPYYDYERKLAITSDAIIDNREELFEKLQINRYERKTMPDSQLILLAYDKWEEMAPKHLIGDFAFMIWDERKRKLFGARDFSGSRTLYYYNDNQRFAFCTTIEPLLRLPYIDNQLNEEWLAEFLAISGVVDTADVSITPYKKIAQLPPSHSFSISRGKVSIRRYSFLSETTNLRLKSDDDYVEAFQEIYQNAVKTRTRTNKLVGAQLSGGLDSGSVVSIAARTLNKENREPLHTFSYIPPKDFEDYTPRNSITNESPNIKSTVSFVGGINDHYLDFDGKDSYSEVNDFLEIMEMPYKFFENSFWIKGIYEEAKAQGVGILLNGSRGNLSVSWGPADEYYSLLLKRMKWIKLYQEVGKYSENIRRPRRRILQMVFRNTFPGLNQLFLQNQLYQIPSLINPAFAEKSGVFIKLRNYGIGETGWLSSEDVYEQRRRHFEDVFHWNASNTLATKCSLRYGVISRDPTNDLRVVRFCLSLPEDQYVQNGLDRALIRRSTENYLPENVRLNQRTRGVQGADWIHRIIPNWGMFLEEIKMLMKDQNVFQFLNKQVIEHAFNKANAGVLPKNATDPDYRLLMRAIIFYRFLKKHI